MTEFEETYYRLILLDPPLRRQWLLDQQPAEGNPALWWYALIDAAVSDVRYRQDREWSGSRPRADQTLAACLIEWASEQGFPVEVAVVKLTELVRITVDSGQPVQDLPHNARPDAIACHALNGFAMTREQAIARAANLRAKPPTDDDLVQPGEDLATSLRAIVGTDDYRDYHMLLNIDRMLTDLASLIDLITDPDLAAEVRAWLSVLPDLDPVPTIIAISGRQTPTQPEST